MRRIFSLATAIYLILLFVSCTSVKTLVVNVQKPAQIYLPNTIENIGIVNNTILQYNDLGYSNYKYTKKGEQTNPNINVSEDSTCYILTKKLFEDITNLNTFNRVTLYEFPLREDITYLKELPLDSVSAKELCKLLNSDAIISIDQFIINSIYHEEFLGLDAIAGYLDLRLQSTFRIYDKYGNSVSTPYYVSDSIFWDAVYTPNSKFLLSENAIPSKGEAINQAGMYVGEQIAKAFVPSWKEQVRIYYTNYNEANKLISKNKWEEALEISEKAFNKEEKLIKKARLANNIALAYELSDNIEQAIKWAQTAVQLFSKSPQNTANKKSLSRSSIYYKELLQRNKDFKVLETQEYN